MSLLTIDKKEEGAGDLDQVKPRKSSLFGGIQSCDTN